MNKLTIPALVSACIFFLAFDALAGVAYVEIGDDHDCARDHLYGPITLQPNWTALDLLDYACDIDYDVTQWGVFVTRIGSVEPVYDPPAFEDWFMFTVDPTDGDRYMEDHDLRNYTVQDGDIIGMWNVTGYQTSWPPDYCG